VVTSNLHCAGQGLCTSFYRSALSDGIHDDWELMNGVTDLLQREWSCRIWTLQETVLAPHPWILCGDKILPWRSMIHSLIFLDVASNLTGFRSLDEKVPEDDCYRWRRIVTLWLAIQFPAPSQAESELDYASEIRAFHGSLGEYACFDKKARKLFERLMRINIAVLVGLATIGGMIISVVHGWGNPFVVVLACLPFLIFSLGFTRHIGFDAFVNPNTKMSRSIQVKNTAIQEATVQEILARRSKDPKDKSYGMHSVLRKMGVQLSAPDYRRSLFDVYRELFISLYGWTRSPSILLLASGPEVDGQASWVPNWHADPILTAMEWTCNNFIETHSFYGEEDSAKHLHNLSTLSDLVREYRSQSPWAWRSEVYSLFDTWLYAQRGDVSRLKFIAGALGPESDNDDHDDEFDEVDALIDFYLLSPRSAFDRIKSLLNIRDFHLYLCETLSTTHRTLFLGSYQLSSAGYPSVVVGDCHKHVRVSNIIALVSKVAMPLVLEEQESSHRLIGGSIINGLMRGKGLESLGEEELEDIVLV
jgi:hypothetical protein